MSRSAHFELWQASRVRRFHTDPAALEQNLADHSWGVAFFLDRLHPNPSANLFRCAIRHDLAERWTGDLPSPVKWDNPDLVCVLTQIERAAVAEHIGAITLTDEEHQWLKWCDLLELISFSAYSAMLGNNLAYRIYLRGRKVLYEKLPPEQVLRTVLEIDLALEFMNPDYNLSAATRTRIGLTEKVKTLT